MIKRLRKLAAYLASIALPIMSLCVLVSMISTRALPWAVVVGRVLVGSTDGLRISHEANSSRPEYYPARNHGAGDTLGHGIA
jgi:hypothetical protein